MGHRVFCILILLNHDDDDDKVESIIKHWNDVEDQSISVVAIFEGLNAT